MLKFLHKVTQKNMVRAYSVIVDVAIYCKNIVAKFHRQSSQNSNNLSVWNKNKGQSGAKASQKYIPTNQQIPRDTLASSTTDW